jgi:hypothetical protein
MNLPTSYVLVFCSLLLSNGAFNPGARTGMTQPMEWFRIEALDLQLSSPCYDVAFFRDAILYLKPGVETIYQFPLDNPDPVESRPLFANMDISCSPAAITFSDDYRSGYCTRPVMGHVQVYAEKIFEFSIEDNRATAWSLAPFSDDPSRSLHPALSRDGSILVFSSDRLPTQGGLDLFVTYKTETGWSGPVNLGEAINTSGHEWFPFLDGMNNLWFSSTGHSGYGGYDIFVCAYDGTTWGLPRNLGEYINGPQNELGFSIHPLKQLALFSKTLPGESEGMAMMVSLNEEAFDAAGIDEPSARNLALLMQRLADPVPQASISRPTGSESQPVQEQVPESERTRISGQQQESRQQQSETGARENITGSASSANASSEPVIFRVQIISSLYENSFPTVFIDGRSYSTYQYFYMGSYRITVGEFNSLKEANEFRLKCLNSGFKQAFVAAFRGDTRVTDPSVYKQ